MRDSIHGVLYKIAADICGDLTKKGEKLTADVLALRLYHEVRKSTSEYRMQMLEILAQDGAHQFAMEVLRKWGPGREATTKQIEEAIDKKEEAEEAKEKPLFKWGNVEVAPEEDDILCELDKYGLRRVRTKAEYVLIAIATAEQLREAIALRAIQVQTMQIENDLLERLAKLRE